MQQWELGILDWIQANLRCGVLDVLMPALSWTCNHGEIWIVLAAVLLAVKRCRRQGLAVGCALVTDLVLCNLILKPLVGRVRPFAVHPVELLIPAAYGCLVPIRAHGGILCGGVCPEGQRLAALETGTGGGRGYGLFPTVPVCPLAQRRAGRRAGGRGGWLHRGVDRRRLRRA